MSQFESQKDLVHFEKRFGKRQRSLIEKRTRKRSFAMQLLRKSCHKQWKSEKETKRRIELARDAVHGTKPILANHNISMWALHRYVLSVLLYDWETKKLDKNPTDKHRPLKGVVSGICWKFHGKTMWPMDKFDSRWIQSQFSSKCFEKDKSALLNILAPHISATGRHRMRFQRYFHKLMGFDPDEELREALRDRELVKVMAPKVWLQTWHQKKKLLGIG